MAQRGGMTSRLPEITPGVVADLSAPARMPSISALREHSVDVEVSAFAVAGLLEARRLRRA